MRAAAILLCVAMGALAQETGGAKADPRLAEAQSQLARREFDAALKTARSVLESEPENLNAKLLAASALLGLGRNAESRKLVQEAREKNPASGDVLFRLGALELADKRVNEAEDAFRKCLELQPSYGQCFMGLVETYMAGDRPELAETLILKEVARQPRNALLRLAAGNVAVRSRRYDLAIQQFEAALQLYEDKSPQAGEIWLRIGETHRLKGDPGAAVGALQKAREILPTNPAAVNALALALDGADRKKEAIAAYRDALKLDANNAVALNNLAFALCETGGDLDEALAHAKRARELLPAMDEISDTFGWVLLKKNLPGEALPVFRELVKKQPGRAAYRYHLALALQQQGDAAAAAAELEAALKANPTKEEESKIREALEKR